MRTMRWAVVMALLATAAPMWATGGALTPGVRGIPARGAPASTMPRPTTTRREPAAFVGSRSALPPAQLAFSDALHDYLISDMPEPAEKVLTDYLALHPDDEKALLAKAVMARTERGQDATALFEKVIQVRAGSKEAQCAQAMLDVDAGRNLYQAWRTLKRLAETSQTQQFVWLGILAADKLHMGEVRRDLIRSLGLNPGALWLRRLEMKDVVSECMGEPLRIGMVVETEYARRTLRSRADPGFLMYLVRALELSKLHEDADELAAAVVKEIPQDAEAWAIWASALRSADQYDAAIAACKRALELDPACAEAQAVWGHCLEKQGAKEQAQAHYQAVVKIVGGGKQVAAPKLLDRQALLALPVEKAAEEVFSYLSAGRQQEAEQHFAALIAQNPSNQRVQFCRAVCLRSRDIFAARETAELEQIAQMNPRSVEGQAAQLLVAATEGIDRQSACDDLEALAEGNPGDLMLQWLAGYTASELGNYPAGLHRLLANCHIGPGSALMVRAEDSDANVELAIWKVLVETEPAGWTYLGAGRTLKEIGHFKEADEAYALAMPYASFASRWHDWGTALRYWGKYEQAIEKYEKAVSLDAKYAPAYNDWGLALEALNKPAEAMEKYEEAMKADPRSPYAYNNAAALLRRQGDEAGALQMRQRGAAAARGG